jgi:putative transposase
MVLNAAARVFGLPQQICVDNGSELISNALDAWAYRRCVALVFSRPGKSTEHGEIEACNSRFRDECLIDSRGSYWHRIPEILLISSIRGCS